MLRNFNRKMVLFFFGWMRSHLILSFFYLYFVFGKIVVASQYYNLFTVEMDQLSNVFSLLELDAADDRVETTFVAAEGEYEKQIWERFIFALIYGNYRSLLYIHSL